MRRSGKNSGVAKVKRVKNIITGDIHEGTGSELSRELGLNPQQLSTHKKSGDWYEIDENEDYLNPKKDLTGINHPRAKVIKIKNKVTDEVREGCIVTLCKQLGLSKSQISGTNKCRDWYVLDEYGEYIVKDKEIPLYEIVNKKTGDIVKDTLENLRAKYNLKGIFQSTGNKEWVLLKDFKGVNYTRTHMIYEVINIETKVVVKDKLANIRKLYNTVSNDLLTTRGSNGWILLKYYKGEL